MKRIVWIVFFAMSVSAAYAETTACSCSSSKSVREKFKAADMVFTAKLHGYSLNFGSSQAKVIVEKIWKGQTKEGKILSVQLTIPGMACIQEKMEWAQYKSWLVYVRMESGILETALCDGTKPATYAEQEIKILNSFIF